MTFVNQCIVLGILVLSVHQTNAVRQLNIEVYYESLCPDSENFVSDLLPQARLYKDLLNVTFIPFGKAYSYGTKFRCQHGPRECRGNVIQDCALHTMRFHTTIEKVEYVNCELRTRSSPNGNYECVRQAKLNANAVEHCAEGNLGYTLQKKSEKATFSVQKPLVFVPTITFNGMFTQRNQNTAMRNLSKVLSEML